MKKILFSLLLVTAFIFNSQAQLVANAGPDFTITECPISYKQIGGSPTASGGTPPYTYSWTLRRWLYSWYPYNYQNSSSNPTITGADVATVAFHRTTLFSSIDSFFVLRITDALGATATDTVFFDVVPIAVSRSVTNQSAPGVCDGAIQATISGGTPPLSIVWSKPALTPSISGLCPGSYTLAITDVQGCTKTTTDMVECAPGTFNLSLTPTGASCNGGSNGTICANITGGTPGYSYTWSNGANGQCPNNFSAGSYTVTVSDANSCTATATGSVTQPPPINLSIVKTGNGIYPDTLDLTVSGGCAPYTYNWKNGPATQDRSISGTGYYLVTVTDCSGCSNTGSINVGNVLFASAGPDVTVPECYYAYVQIGGSPTALGGTPPYRYKWTPKTWLNNDTFPRPTFYQAGNGRDTTYVLTVTDALGATARDTVFVDVVPSQMSASISMIGNTHCVGAGIIFKAIGSGGYPPYRDSWGGGLWLFGDGGWGGGRGNNTVPHTYETPGTYTVRVQLFDTMACSAIATVNVTQTQVTATTTVTEETIPGACDASITTSVTGGTPPYSYHWINSATTPAITGLCTGLHPLMVTDVQGCTSTTNDMVGDPSITVTYPNGGETFSTGQNVNVTWTSTGIIPKVKIEFYSSISFTWITLADSVANTGTYLFTIPQVPNMQGRIRISDPYNSLVTDQSDSLFNILNCSGFQIDSITSTNVSCFGANDGTACAVVSGGTPPYNYSWSSSPNTQCITVLSANTYIVTVTEAGNNCTATASTTITQPAQLSVQVTSATSGALPDTLCATATGGTPPVLYNWSGNVNGLPNLCFKLLSGSFSLTIEDANGCTDSFSTNSLCPNNCVWPGDADYNGISDNNDLLPIGLAYGKNGPVRAQQDINWYAHPATDWIDTITTTGSGNAGINLFTVASASGISLGMAVSGTGIAAGAVVTSIAGTTIAVNRINTGVVSGTITFTTPSISNVVNSKHIDCDGNGTINANDTVAILQNFGLSHAKTGDQRPWRMTDPSMYVELTPDTTRAGDTMYAYITLGDIGIPANDVYGLAFTFNYDASVVDSTRTAVTFGNSWLGTATDKISLAKNFHPLGQIKCALTRIDHTTRSGFGQIGQVSFVITTDNINGKNLAYYQMNVYITDLVMIDNLGNYITVNEGKDSSLVEFEEVLLGQIGNPQSAIRIAPNPANDQVQISVTEELIGGELKMLDVEGRVLIKQSIPSLNFELRTLNFSPGFYLIQVRTEKGMLTKRLVIAR